MNLHVTALGYSCVFAECALLMDRTVAYLRVSRNPGFFSEVVSYAAFLFSARHFVTLPPMKNSPVRDYFLAILLI